MRNVIVLPALIAGLLALATVQGEDLALPKLPPPERVYVYIAVPFVVDGQQRTVHFMRDYADVEAARAKHAGEDVVLFFQGRELDTRNPGADPGDGTRYWLSYTFDIETGNTSRMEAHLNLKDALAGLEAARRRQGFKFPHLYAGKALAWR